MRLKTNKQQQKLSKTVQFLFEHSNPSLSLAALNNFLKVSSQAVQICEVGICFPPPQLWVLSNTHTC